MNQKIIIFGTEIELDSDQYDSIKNGLLNTKRSDLVSEFANIIIKLQATGYDVYDLLSYTAGTVGKLYDSEEENMTIIEDTTNWINGNASFMSD